MTRTDLPPGDVASPTSPEPARPSRRAADLRRLRRGLGRRAREAQRRRGGACRRLVARAVHTWRSSLQVRIGAITMIVAGTVVVIVSLVLFSQIRDQLLRVKRQAAIDQAQAGVLYAQSQVAGIATGDAASVRTALDRTVTQLRQPGRRGRRLRRRHGLPDRQPRDPGREQPARPRGPALADLRADVDNGGQS